MFFGKKYKMTKTAHVMKDLEENNQKWGWTYRVESQEYFFFIGLGWDFEDNFEDRLDAQRYIEYKLNPTYYS